MSTMNRPAWTREQIHEALWAVAAEHSGQDASTLTPATRPVQDLGFDSLDLVELTMEVESRLGLTVPDELMERRELTLGDIEDTLCGADPDGPAAPVSRT
jgi:acyl carrier protein